MKRDVKFIDYLKKEKYPNNPFTDQGFYFVFEEFEIKLPSKRQILNVGVEVNVSFFKIKLKFNKIINITELVYYTLCNSNYFLKEKIINDKIEIIKYLNYLINNNKNEVMFESRDENDHLILSHTLAYCIDSYHPDNYYKKKELKKIIEI